MLIVGSYVGAHNIHRYLPMTIKECNIVIKKRSHCGGLEAQPPSAEL